MAVSSQDQEDALARLEFYDNLERGNAINYQQGQNNIRLALTSQITNLILDGQDMDKVKDLIDLMKDFK